MSGKNWDQKGSLFSPQIFNAEMMWPKMLFLAAACCICPAKCEGVYTRITLPTYLPTYLPMAILLRAVVRTNWTTCAFDVKLNGLIKISLSFFFFFVILDCVWQWDSAQTNTRFFRIKAFENLWLTLTLTLVLALNDPHSHASTHRPTYPITHRIADRAHPV